MTTTDSGYLATQRHPLDHNRDQQFERLPAWARRELDRLATNLASANARLSAGPESNTVADPSTPSPRPLGNNPCVQHLHNGSSTEVKFLDGVLKITTFGGGLLIEPDVSNIVRIRTNTDVW
jgi:hypothetical protein